MKIYKLTPLGIRAARTVNNPETVNWAIVHYLDHVGNASDDQISSYCGGNVGSNLMMLRKKRLIEEV